MMTKLSILLSIKKTSHYLIHYNKSGALYGVLLLSSMFFWFKDVISEATYIGNHILAVQKGLNMGIALFIVWNASFLLAIFSAYFYGTLTLKIELTNLLYFGFVLFFSSMLIWFKHFINKSTCKGSNTFNTQSHLPIVWCVM